MDRDTVLKDRYQRLTIENFPYAEGSMEERLQILEDLILEGRLIENEDNRFSE